MKTWIDIFKMYIQYGFTRSEAKLNTIEDMDLFGCGGNMKAKMSFLIETEKVQAIMTRIEFTSTLFRGAIIGVLIMIGLNSTGNVITIEVFPKSITMTQDAME